MPINRFLQLLDLEHISGLDEMRVFLAMEKAGVHREYFHQRGLLMAASHVVLERSE